MTTARRGKNDYRIEGNVAYLALTQGKETLIDVDDLDRVLDYRWHANKTGPARPNQRMYASSGSRDKPTLYLHRFISNAAAGEYVDHINGDGLDNRKENLRFATNQQNAQNRVHLDARSKTGVRGVSVHKSNDGRLYYIAKVSVTRYFPFTDEGFQEAKSTAADLRGKLKGNGLT